jgi:hypothetical protein
MHIRVYRFVSDVWFLLREYILPASFQTGLTRIQARSQSLERPQLLRKPPTGER